MKNYQIIMWNFVICAIKKFLNPVLLMRKNWELVSMSDVTRSLRIPIKLDAEIEEHKPKMNITNRYVFFLTLGLKLYTHKTLLERNPEVMEIIVNHHVNTLHDMKVSLSTGIFFKDMSNRDIDSIKYLVEIEQNSRRKEEERQAKNNRW